MATRSSFGTPRIRLPLLKSSLKTWTGRNGSELGHFSPCDGTSRRRRQRSNRTSSNGGEPQSEVSDVPFDVFQLVRLAFYAAARRFRHKTWAATTDIPVVVRE